MTQDAQELTAEHFDRVVQGALSVGAQVVRIVGLVVIFRGRQFSVTSEPRTTGTAQRVFVAYTTADDGLDNIEACGEGSTIMEALEAAMDEAAVVEGAA